MTKVVASTPSDAAAAPSHPDHARWVKETTLKMEVQHAQRAGGTLRDAERENARLLERMEALARNERPAVARPRKSRQQRMLDRAVEVREALPRPAGLTWLSSSPCGRCGVCRACRREKRILQVSNLAKQRDPWALKAMWGISLVLLRANAKTGEFRGKGKVDINRIVTAEAERLCDDSIKRLGQWE